MTPQPWWNGREQILRVLHPAETRMKPNYSDISTRLWSNHYQKKKQTNKPKKKKNLYCNIYTHIMAKIFIRFTETLMPLTRTSWLKGHPARIYETCIWYICWEKNLYSTLAFLHSATDCPLFWITFSRIHTWIVNNLGGQGEYFYLLFCEFLSFFYVYIKMWNSRFLTEKNMAHQKPFILSPLYFLPRENKTKQKKTKHHLCV